MEAEKMPRPANDQEENKGVNLPRRKFLKQMGATAIGAVAGSLASESADAKGANAERSAFKRYEKNTRVIDYLQKLTDKEIEKLNSSEIHTHYVEKYNDLIKMRNENSAIFSAGIGAVGGGIAGEAIGAVVDRTKDGDPVSLTRRMITGAVVGSILGGTAGANYPYRIEDAGEDFLYYTDPVDFVLMPYIVKNIPITHEIINNEIEKLHANNIKIEKFYANSNFPSKLSK